MLCIARAIARLLMAAVRGGVPVVCQGPTIKCVSHVPQLVPMLTFGKHALHRTSSALMLLLDTLHPGDS
jgi:hypothetical protein